MSTSRRHKRIRAHANPLSIPTDVPLHPDAVPWSSLYPRMLSQSDSHSDRRVTIADVGCGFAGLLVALAPLYPDRLILGMEIRDRVVEIGKARIEALRAQARSGGSESSCWYDNIAVVKANVMKSAVNYFHKHQLDKMFILFPDPHFKRSNHRRRVISTLLLDYYAFVLKPGAILYTITDVLDMHQWIVKHTDAHPLFVRMSEEELANDPCVHIMTTATEEGKKVEKLSGSKYPAVYRRISDEEALSIFMKASSGDKDMAVNLLTS